MYPQLFNSRLTSVKSHLKALTAALLVAQLALGGVAMAGNQSDVKEQLSTLDTLMKKEPREALIKAKKMLKKYRDEDDREQIIFFMNNARFKAGQKALKQEQWSQAIRYFSSLAKDEAHNADAGLYWQAYAAFHAGYEDKAQRSLQRLREDYPDSKWIDDAQVLSVEFEKPSETLSPDDFDNQELKVYALATLMDEQPERALPLAKKLLKQTEKEELREHILFVMSTSKLPEAQNIIRDIALNGQYPELQEHAIYLLADLGGQKSADELFQLYQKAPHEQAKVNIIYALANNQQLGYVQRILKQEDSSDLQAVAIMSLANMEAVDAIRDLDITKLQDEAQQAAIYALTETSSINENNLQLLDDIYNKATDDTIREVIIHAYGSNGQVDLLSKALRTEQDPDLQATIIYSLMSANAYDQLRGLELQKLSEEPQEALIHAYAQMNEHDVLMGLLDDLEDSDLRTHVIHSLASSDDPKVGDLLKGRYEKANDRDEREALIHAFMIRDAIDTFLELMRKEKVPELKTEILQALVHSDRPEVRELLFELLERS